ncbi:MAG: AraC family transcriptional regulator ligand-binding domain-containing protein [Polyangiales bacterium]
MLQLRQLARAIERLGIPSEPIFSRAGLTKEQLADESARAPAGIEIIIWDYIAEASGDPLIALKVSDVIGPGALGAYEYLIRNTQTPRQAIELADRYARFVDDLTRVSLIELSDDAVACRIAREAGYPHSPYGIESTIACLVSLIKPFAPPGCVKEVHFTHRGSDEAAYAEHLGVPVRFSAAHNQFLFARVMLDMPNPLADPRLGEVLEAHVQHTVANLPSEAPFLVRARTLLGAALQSNAASLEQLATDLHVSTRTLRRRLELHGTSYKDLLDSVRKQLAAHHVTRTDDNFDQIARKLGFSEASTFYRAFKRWFDTTPAAYRSLHPQTR